MLVGMKTMLRAAMYEQYAVGGFNIYNLEGIHAVVRAAEAENSPVMLQVHPGAYAYGGIPLVDACLAAAEMARVPVGVHLDHADDRAAIRAALDEGVSSVMVDGSHLDFVDNMNFVKEMSVFARAAGADVEAELGRIAGTEDGLTVEQFEARYTDPLQAIEFVSTTQVDALAVCIGNVHGKYPRPPQLDFDRLAQIKSVVDVPLVLHGASGVPDDQIRRSIELGVCKFNVNTEVRGAFVAALRENSTDETLDLLPLLETAVAAMEGVIRAKMQLFGSSGKA